MYFPEAATIVYNEKQAAAGLLGVDGFCCTCGKPDSKLTCPACNRVTYCSTKCMKKDAKKTGEVGHSKEVCDFLSLCNEDEQIEATSSRTSTSSVYNEAAFDRVLSEKHSYPATLSNALLDHPTYEELMSNDSLCIHVIGASDAELWPKTNNDEQSAIESYREALDDVIENFTTSEISFIGPNVPDDLKNKNKKNAKLRVSLHNQSYETAMRMDINLNKRPDICVFFNPGFTVNEYNWVDALSVIPDGTLFLVATNTELEAIADIECLVEMGKFQKPAEMEDDAENDDTPSKSGKRNCSDDNDDAADLAGKSFIAPNPWCGSRVRQSGSFANDLYVKNYYLFGGTLRNLKSKVELKTTKRKAVEVFEDEEEEVTNNNKKKSSESSGNKNLKKNNRALI